MDWEAIRLSLKLSAATTLILLVVGAPLAYWLAFSPRRWKIAIEAVVALPLVLPPTVLGFYLLVAMGPRSPIGQAYVAVFGTTLPFSFEGLLTASVLYSLPFTVQPLTASFAAVDRRFIEASWTLGVSRLKTFFRLIAPVSAPGILTAVVLSFAHTMGEFGVVLMVGGNLPGETRTVSISIYDSVQALDYTKASATALFLLTLAALALVLTYTVGRRYANPWTRR